MILRALDFVLLVTIVAAPWFLLVAALEPFRHILRRDARWILTLAIGLWIFLTSLLSPLTETFVQGLIHATTKPWFAAYTHSILTEGRAPLWHSYLGAGLPALADPYVAYMSPFTSLLFLFQDLDQGVNVLVLVHLVFAGLCAFILGRSLHLSRLSSLVLALVFLLNPWVFGKLETGIHALYIFGYAWIPLTWMLLLRFRETRRLLDAARIGVPLAFMAVSMPTVFAQMIAAVVLVLVVSAVPELWRRQWRILRQISVGLVVLVAATFLTAAPEHLAARELLATNQGTRFGIARMGGWRDRDLSTREFLRVLFPDKLGDRLFSLPYRAGSFGVPFSPGDLSVLLGILGWVVVAKRPSLRVRFRPFAHLALFLVVASITTHGIFYEPIMRTYALWAATGNFPVVGALLLIAMTPFIGAGVETMVRGITHLGRIITTRVPASARVWQWRIFLQSPLQHITGRTFHLVVVCVLAADLFWGVDRLVEVVRGTERLIPRYTIPVMRLSDLGRAPHLEYLQQRAEEHAEPLRIYCTGDIGVWPSPCFDFLADRHGLEIVGIGEIGWAMPRWQWQLFTGLWSEWRGPFSTLFQRALQLAGVRSVVSSRTLDLPLAAEVSWNPVPGSFDLWGRLLESSIGGGPWKEEWDRTIRIHDLPNAYPHVFFADAVRVDGSLEEQEQTVRLLLSQSAVDPRKIAFFHTDVETATSLASLPLPVLPGAPDAVVQRDKLLAQHPALGRPVPRWNFRRAESPYPGAWVAEGTAPHAGAFVFTQMYYPGFRATANGRPASVVRTDLFATGVPVPAGDVTVKLEYAPYGIMGASLLTLAFTLVLGIGTQRALRTEQS